jgi:hypothetical protein
MKIIVFFFYMYIRGNSFFTKVIDNYMKMSGREFLEEALQFTIQKICKFSLHIEVTTINKHINKLFFIFYH